MKKRVNYILAGMLALLGFSSCSALREARQARQEREQKAAEAQQQALVEQILQEMEENEPPQIEVMEREQIERAKLLYAVPNAPYREIKEN